MGGCGSTAAMQQADLERIAREKVPPIGLTVQRDGGQPEVDVEVRPWEPVHGSLGKALELDATRYKVTEAWLGELRLESDGSWESQGVVDGVSIRVVVSATVEVSIRVAVSNGETVGMSVSRATATKSICTSVLARLQSKVVQADIEDLMIAGISILQRGCLPEYVENGAIINLVLHHPTQAEARERAKEERRRVQQAAQQEREERARIAQQAKERAEEERRRKFVEHKAELRAVGLEGRALSKMLFAERHGLFPISYKSAGCGYYCIVGLSPDGKLVKMRAPHQERLPDAKPADGMHIKHSEGPGIETADKFAERHGLFPISYKSAGCGYYCIVGLSPDGELVKMRAPHQERLPDASLADGMRFHALLMNASPAESSPAEHCR